MTEPASTHAASRRSHRTAPLWAALALATLLATIPACDRAERAPQAATADARVASAEPRGGVASPPAATTSAAPSGAENASTPRYASDDRGDGSTLPAAIARGLQTDQRVLECAAGMRDGVSQFAADWVGVRRIDLDGDGRRDWIVNGLHPCLRVDGTPAWWVYVDHDDGMRLALAGQPAITLQVLGTRSAGLRDLVAEGGDGEVVALRANDVSYAAVPGDALPPTTEPSNAR